MSKIDRGFTPEEPNGNFPCLEALLARDAEAGEAIVRPKTNTPDIDAQKLSKPLQAFLGDSSIQKSAFLSPAGTVIVIATKDLKSLKFSFAGAPVRINFYKNILSVHGGPHHNFSQLIIASNDDEAATLKVSSLNLTVTPKLTDKTSEKVAAAIQEKPQNVENTDGTHPIATSFYLSSIIPIAVDSADEARDFDSLGRTSNIKDTPQYWALVGSVWYTCQYKEILLEKFPQAYSVIETVVKSEGSDWQIKLPNTLQNNCGRMIYLRDVPKSISTMTQNMIELAGINPEPEDVTPVSVRFVDSAA